MSTSEGTTTEAPTASSDGVHLELPADPRYLRMVRLTATGYASDLGFTIDEIEELRLAVDEACALLIEHAPDDARLALTYCHEGSLLTIEGSCPTHAAVNVEPDPVAHAVLHTTVDAFEVLPAVDGATTFRLRKRGAIDPT